MKNFFYGFLLWVLVSGCGGRGPQLSIDREGNGSPTGTGNPAGGEGGQSNKIQVQGLTSGSGLTQSEKFKVFGGLKTPLQGRLEGGGFHVVDSQILLGGQKLDVKK